MGSEIRKENVDAQRGSHILKLKSSTGHRHDAFAISKKTRTVVPEQSSDELLSKSHY